LKQVFISIASRLGTWALNLGKSLLGGVWTIIRTIASALWSGITTAFETIAGALGAAGLIVVAAFVAFFASMFLMAEEEGDTFQETWDRMWNNIFTTIQWYGEHIASAVGFIVDNAAVIFKNLGAGIANFFLGTWDAVMETATTGYNFMVGILNSVVEAMLTPINAIFQVFGKLLSGLGDMIADNPGIASLFDIDPATVAGLQGAGKALQDMKTTDIIPPAEQMAAHVKSRRYAYADAVEKSDVKTLSEMQLEMNGPERAPAKVTAAEIEQGKKDYRAKKGLPDLAMGAGVLADKGGPTDWVSVASANKENSAAVVTALENPKWAADQITEAAKQTAILETIKQVLQQNRDSTAAPA